MLKKALCFSFSFIFLLFFSFVFHDCVKYNHYQQQQ